MTIENKEIMRWYAVRVATGKENTVLATLRAAIERNEHEESFGELLVPSEDVVDVRSGVKRNIKRKFFPGYILVEMIKNDRTYDIIKNTPGILGFVGGLNSRALSEADVKRLMDRVKQNDAGPRLKVQFHVGELVRVKEGPFADFNGAIEKIMAEKHRLVVSVFIFGRSTPIELEYGQVEKTT